MLTRGEALAFVVLVYTKLANYPFSIYNSKSLLL